MLAVLSSATRSDIKVILDISDALDRSLRDGASFDTIAPILADLVRRIHVGCEQTISRVLTDVSARRVTIPSGTGPRVSVTYAPTPDPSVTSVLVTIDGVNGPRTFENHVGRKATDPSVISIREFLAAIAQLR